ncbi:MAG: TIGR02147 family protein [Bdellovibrionota bacterium]
MLQNTSDEQVQLKIWLQTEFTRRCRVNSRYSIRAFAKQLDINQSTLTQILNGKRKVSKKFIEGLEKKIGVKFHFQGNGQNDLDFKYSVLSVDAFTVISDWYHYAILEFTAVKGFKSDAKWISKKLGITVSEANMAIDRMLRLGMILEKNGKISRSKQYIVNYTEGVTSGAHKEFQRQLLSKALSAIDNCPQDKKDITSMTMPANSKKIKEVKEKIRKFRREICDYLEDGNHDSVYQMCVQLFPLTDEI